MASSRSVASLAFWASSYGVAALVAVSVAGCTVGTDADAGPRTEAGSCGVEGEISCAYSVVRRCTGGQVVDGETCAATDRCVPGLGCRRCVPGSGSCDGQSVLRCNAEGTGYDPVETCDQTHMCRVVNDGVSGPTSECFDACAATVPASNIGCEYYAVDLDQGPSTAIPPARDAQFAVMVANPWSGITAHVTVERNSGGAGALVTETVYEGDVGPNQIQRIDLPAREVDGGGANEPGEGTQLTSNAYRIIASYPVIAYQFNTIEASFSSDASLLIPVNGLDRFYRVLSYPPAPRNISPFPERVSRSYVTIVGTAEGTTVEVTSPIPIAAGGTIAAVPAGETLRMTLGPFDVLNLESTEVDEADFTGTFVQSSAPVVVFAGTERSAAPYTGDNMLLPTPPGTFAGTSPNLCCHDHLEEQVFPVTSWSREFVAGHSPVRSTNPAWVEPDIYRVMADRQPTRVRTSLPAPFDDFMVQPGEFVSFYAQSSFALEADQPVGLAQILVSQAVIPNLRDEGGSGSLDPHGGDPSLTYIPASEQYRDNYVFLTPDTFDSDYVVITAPTGSRVLLDGETVVREFGGCTREDVRTPARADGTSVDYTVWTCEVRDGAHRVEADAPVGLVVYGYMPQGSYAYTGGSDFERINVY